MKAQERAASIVRPMIVERLMQDGFRWLGSGYGTESGRERMRLDFRIGDEFVSVVVEESSLAKGCPISSHACDCTCEGRGGDR